MSAGMLTLERVSVRYDGSFAVREVTESATAGEWLGVIGPNGAGKSSLLRAIAHLVRHEGIVRVDGQLVSRLSRRRRAQLVAYVPQQPELPAGMSVVDYVVLGRTPHIGYFGVESEADREVCLEVLNRLDLASMADRLLATLSGGELQRTVLARALAQDAPVLLLDEPTSALDLGRRVDALELVDELRRERGLTVLSAMHDLTLAAQFADRLILLSTGQVIAAGDPRDVLNEDVLTACFGARVRVLHDEHGGLLVVPQRAHGRVVEATGC
jgi:iron complex transport system ATP-binding protein